MYYVYNIYILFIIDVDGRSPNNGSYCVTLLSNAERLKGAMSFIKVVEGGKRETDDKMGID